MIVNVKQFKTLIHIISHLYYPNTYLKVKNDINANLEIYLLDLI